MSRAERVQAAAVAMDSTYNTDKYPILSAMFRDYADAALAASDALLRTDAAVERVAVAISWESSGIDEDDWSEVGAMPIAIKESFRELARAAIAALLDGEH